MSLSSSYFESSKSRSHICGLCCSLVSQNMSVTLKQKGAMLWQGLTEAASSWTGNMLGLLIIVQPSFKSLCQSARVFGKQCVCALILNRQALLYTHLQNGLTNHVYHNNINLHAWEILSFFSKDVTYLQIPFQCDPGTWWWQVSSSGSSLDYTKQLTGPSVACFQQVSWKIKSNHYVNTLKCVSNLHFQMWSFHVWYDHWPRSSSYWDFGKKHLERI